ncbi:MAG TPA: hypothetical protein VGS19_15540 [Streptosporangiaceae bacterium]|nr:hypothetical protein [Streptosporangiaceae bacterium]
MLTSLAHARTDQDWDERHLDLLNTVLPNGTCRPDTPSAVTVLARMILADALTSSRRCDIYATLVYAASRYASDTITGADIAAATGRPPHPLRWAEQARDAVGATAPDLLARWDTEPAANRAALTAVAALFPSHGRAVATRVAALAAAQQGTKAGTCAQIACHLIAGQTQEAATNAALVSLWGETPAEYDTGNEALGRVLLAEAIVCDEVSKLLPRGHPAPCGSAARILNHTTTTGRASPAE